MGKLSNNDRVYFAGSVLFIVCTAALLFAISGNWRARTFGGHQTVRLSAGSALVNVSWKETDLWILTRPMKDGELATTYELQEKSTLGLLNGSVTIVESANEELGR